MAVTGESGSWMHLRRCRLFRVRQAVAEVRWGGCAVDAFIVFMSFLDAGYGFLIVGLMTGMSALYLVGLDAADTKSRRI